ncbi:sulfurtransferase complex subunit TusB [Candidatus Magnetaquicoccus inordinatus]|uniref:sulfurtransferase complex subunit TusB n=1 Tax=Candidatus Magnetaquicoccus inordinatus TaxID=2496818 RepID=UPI00102C72F4|nr:sulfurtransferase complex subunit TusB [Candidatus Magnetaquicoccus inordinatus]
MLHTVNKSPFQNTTLSDCCRYVQSGDVLLLLEDGVFAAQAGTSQSALLEEVMQQVTVYALSADLKARAIKELVAGVKVTDYAGFVELIEQHKVHSWL